MAAKKSTPKKNRVPIPDALAAEVMFASDRTCCVCRNPARKTEIHHIDSDPSNNAFNNLAVVCKDCQSDAHTIHSFARNLTPQAVLLYNESWRQLVSTRLKVGEDTDKLKLALRAAHDVFGLANVFLQSLNGTAWQHKHEWTDNGPLDAPYNRTLNIKYTDENWAIYRPVFDTRLKHLADQLEHLHTLYRDVLTYAQRVRLVDAVRQFLNERGQFLNIPNYRIPDRESGQQSLFSVRFTFVSSLAQTVNDEFLNDSNAISEQLDRHRHMTE